MCGKLTVRELNWVGVDCQASQARWWVSSLLLVPGFPGDVGGLLMGHSSCSDTLAGSRWAAPRGKDDPKKRVLEAEAPAEAEKRKKVVCYKCNKEGHYANQCHKFGGGDGKY